MRGRLVEDRIEERICKIRVIDGVIANYYPQEELIRCKDCKHLTHTPHKWYCPINRKVVYRDEFCCWAERRDK